MPSFSYTTGNPSNLVANQNASMADIQGPFTDLRTFLNSGTMDETNVPNLSAAFTTYKTVLWGGASQVGGGGGTFLLNTGPTSIASSGLSAVGASPNTASVSEYLDPSDWVANARLTKLRVRVVLFTNAVAPAINFTTGLYPVATWGGASGATPTIATLGTVVSGSTVAVNAPGASNGGAVGTSGDFNAPAAGHYALATVLSGPMAAGAAVMIQVHVQVRQV